MRRVEMSKDIPKEWEKGKLGDYAEVQNGYAFKSKNFGNIPGIPIVKIKNIAAGKLNLDTSDITYYNKPLDNLSKFIIKKRDILIAMTGSHVYQPSSMVGRVARYLLEEISLLNQRVGRIYSINRNILSEDFLFYFLKQEDITYKLATNAGGSANQANISPNMIKSLEILLPPLPEQKAIAAVLSSLDDKIELLHRENETLEQMAEALFRKWFIKDAKEDWEEVKLKELVNILPGFAFKSKDYVKYGQYRLITIKNVQNGYLDLSRVNYIEKLPKRMPNYCMLSEGDILLSLTGHVGRCCLVVGKNLLLNQRVAKLEPKNNRNWAFVYILFRLYEIKRLLEEIAKGTAQPNLSPIETANIAIKIPPNSTLLNFSIVATPLIKKVLANKQQIRTLENLRDTLLPKLMSGKVRVKF